jgi:hypothetical protein
VEVQAVEVVVVAEAEAEAVVVVIVVVATTGNRTRAIPIHPSSRPRILFATGRRGPADRCICRISPVARD